MKTPPRAPDADAKKNLRNAVAKMEHFCAHQERCEQEVKEKMKVFALSKEDAELVLTHLREEKFLNESRFIGCFIRDKFRFKRWGRVRLRMELQRRGIASDTIDQALEDEISPEEYEQQLKEVFFIKNRQIKDEEPYTRRAKLAKFALGRGFEMGLIWQTLGKLDLGSSEDDSAPRYEDWEE